MGGGMPPGGGIGGMFGSKGGRANGGLGGGPLIMPNGGGGGLSSGGGPRKTGDWAGVGAGAVAGAGLRNRTACCAILVNKVKDFNVSSCSSSMHNTKRNLEVHHTKNANV